MKEYRVTKYDPALRSPSGQFTGDDWISVTEIGQSFGGIVLTQQEYQRVESAYVDTALAFLLEGGVKSLKVESLENRKKQLLTFREGTILLHEQLRNVIGRLLRDELRCRLEAENGFVHIGYDYYMYIGVLRPCISAERKATELGLYVEEFESPHHPETQS